MMLAVAKCVEELEDSVGGKDVEQNRLNSGFDDGGSFPPQTISSFDPKSSELTTSQGLLASSTLQVTKGNGNFFHDVWDNFIGFLPAPAPVLILVSCRPRVQMNVSRGHQET